MLNIINTGYIIWAVITLCMVCRDILFKHKEPFFTNIELLRYTFITVSMILFRVMRLEGM